MTHTHAIARRATLPIAIVLALGCAGTAMPVQSAHAEASAATLNALADAQWRYEQACGELNYMYQLCFEAQDALEQTEWQLAATNDAIAVLQEQIEQEKAELAEAQDILAERLAANYRAGDVELFDVVLSATSFDDLVSRIYYANKVSDADAQAIQTVKDIKAQLEESEAALQEQRIQQEALQAQQAAQLEELSWQTNQVQEYVNSLDWEVQALYQQAQYEAQMAAQAALEAQQAAAQQQAAAVIEQAANNGYYYDEDSGSWSDSSGNYVDSSYVASNIGMAPSDMGIVDRAYSLIGTSYSTMDCSAFTSAALGYSHAVAKREQYNMSVANGTYTTDVNSIAPGSPVFYSWDGTADGMYHVALYIGNGQVIDSIPNGGVQIRPYNFCDGFMGGGAI